ncbi:hypothetical protein Tco_0984259 [Tanacetum coccineum]
MEDLIAVKLKSANISLLKEAEGQLLEEEEHVLSKTVILYSFVEVATPPSKSETTKGRPKRTAQNEDAPRQTAWTNEEEIALCKGWIHIRLIDVTVEQWLDLKYEDHKTMDKNVKEGVIGTWLIRSYKLQFDEYLEIKRQRDTYAREVDMEYNPSNLGKLNWPTFNSNEDGLCNGVDLPGMVRVGYMTYFQDYEWYDDLTDSSLKEEALKQKAIYEKAREG